MYHHANIQQSNKVEESCLVFFVRLWQTVQQTKSYISLYIFLADRAVLTAPTKNSHLPLVIPH